MTVIAENYIFSIFRLLKRSNFSGMLNVRKLSIKWIFGGSGTAWNVIY